MVSMTCDINSLWWVLVFTGPFVLYVLIKFPSTTLSINHHREATALLVVTAYRKLQVVTVLRLDQVSLRRM